MLVILRIAETVTIGSTNFQAFNHFTRFLLEGWSVTKQSNGGSTEFEFELRDYPNENIFLDIEKLTHREITLSAAEDLTNRIFGGILLKARVTTVNPSHRTYKCTALGWEHLMDLSVFSANHRGPVTQGDVLGGRAANMGQQVEEIKSCFELSRTNFRIESHRRGILPWKIERDNIFNESPIFHDFPTTIRT